MQRLEKRLGKERILYMDEAGMLAGDVYRWGWSEKGRRKYGQRSGKRQRRVNFIAAVSEQKQFIEPLGAVYNCSNPLKKRKTAG